MTFTSGSAEVFRNTHISTMCAQGILLWNLSCLLRLLYVVKKKKLFLEQNVSIFIQSINKLTCVYTVHEYIHSCRVRTVHAEWRQIHNHDVC